MSPLSHLAINQATTRPQWSLREAVKGYARAGVRGIGVWPQKVAECGLGTAVRILSDYGMTVTGYCLGDMFKSCDGGLTRQVDEYRRILDDAAELGARCLVSVVATTPHGAKGLSEARRRALDGLAVLVPHALSVGVPLAIEPIHPMRAADLCCVNTLDQANTICEILGEGTGIVVDAYHVWWDPDLERQISRASGRILSYQISDWLVPTRSLVADRGMMGDGVIDLRRLRKLVATAGFDGFSEVEIMSEVNWWKRNPDDVVRVCVDRFQNVC